jgi:hypothetical protein
MEQVGLPELMDSAACLKSSIARSGLISGMLY